MTRPAEPIFDAVVRIDKLPAGGRSIAVDADETERQAIAEAMKREIFSDVDFATYGS